MIPFGAMWTLNPGCYQVLNKNILLPTCIEYLHQCDKKFCSIKRKKKTEPDIQKHYISLEEKYETATPNKKSYTLTFFFFNKWH